MNRIEKALAGEQVETAKRLSEQDEAFIADVEKGIDKLLLKGLTMLAKSVNGTYGSDIISASQLKWVLVDTIRDQL